MDPKQYLDQKRDEEKISFTHDLMRYDRNWSKLPDLLAEEKPQNSRNYNVLLYQPFNKEKLNFEAQIDDPPPAKSYILVENLFFTLYPSVEQSLLEEFDLAEFVHDGKASGIVNRWDLSYHTPDYLIGVNSDEYLDFYLRLEGGRSGELTLTGLHSNRTQESRRVKELLEIETEELEKKFKQGPIIEPKENMYLRNMLEKGMDYKQVIDIVLHDFRKDVKRYDLGLKKILSSSRN